MVVCVGGKCLLTLCERVIQKKTLNPFDVSVMFIERFVHLPQVSLNPCPYFPVTGMTRYS